MSRPTTVLISGLTMPASKKITPDMDTAKFGKMLDGSIERLNSIQGLSHVRFDLDPDSPDSAPDSFAALQRVLREGPAQGGVWDGHVIGRGLKMIPTLTDLFENIINETIQASGKGTKLLFLNTANDHLEVVLRGFPALKHDS